MYNFSSQKAVAKKPSVKVGECESTVTSVHWAEDYAEESAFEVEYTLTYSDGKKSHYSELFYTLKKSPGNQRSIDFYASKVNGCNIEEQALTVACSWCLYNI